MNEFDEYVFDPENELRQVQLAKDHLTKFFDIKKFYCGGSIPKSLLYSNNSIDFVRYTEFDQGIQYCYDLITSQLSPPNGIKSWCDIDWDAHAVLGLLEECRKIHIPLASQAGMILLNFKFCWGCKYVTRKDFLAWAFGEAIAA
jgi:hypothetical protein